MDQVIFQYMESSNSSAFGSVEYTGNQITIQANGLIPQSIYQVYSHTGAQGMTALSETHATPSGSLDITIPYFEYTLPNLCLVHRDNHRIVLHTASFPLQAGQAYLWGQQQFHTSKASKPAHKPLHIRHRTRSSRHVKPHSSPMKTLNQEEELDRLPSVVWSENTQALSLYFERCEPSTNMHIFPIGWRFVRTKTVVRAKTIDCILGKHLKNNQVDRIAYLIPTISLHASQAIPGFQYQKTPDGSGAWIYIEEAGSSSS